MPQEKKLHGSCQCYINAIAACTVLHNMCEINKDIFDKNCLPESEFMRPSQCWKKHHC